MTSAPALPENWLERYAPQARGNGFSCLPVRPGTKVTCERNWQRLCAERADDLTFARWVATRAEFSVGIAGGNFVGIDIDFLDEAVVANVSSLSFELLGETPLQRVGRAPKSLLLYRTSGPIRSGKVGKVDILAHGRYAMAFGVHPDTHRPYHWLGESPATLPLAELPDVDQAQVDQLCAALADFQNMSRPSPVGRRSRSAPRAIRTLDADGKVIDGRDGFLKDLAYAAWANGLDTPEAIADAAWSQFVRRADLTRPKRDGDTPWTHADALEKAKYLLGRNLERPPPRVQFGSGASWPDELKARHQSVVNEFGAMGHLSPAAVAVSKAMLTYIGANGVCFASAERLAAETGLDVRTVKAAKCALLASGLWLASNQRGGRALPALYAPNPEALTWPPPMRKNRK